jgi:Mg-chelatase subunit ChlD
MALALAVIGGLAACDEGGDEEFVVVPVSEEPTVAEPLLTPVSESSVAKSSGTGRPRQGIVTAGDINDTLNLRAFLRYQSKAAADLKLPRLNMTEVYALHVVDAAGNPAPGTLVTLKKPGAADPFYTGRAGVDGRLMVFPRAMNTQTTGSAVAEVFGPDGTSVRLKVAGGAKPNQVTLPEVGPYRPEFLDLVFVIDVSGSMDDEIAWLTKEFSGLVKQMRRTAPQADLRFGLVAYQSPGDAFDVLNFGMTRRAGEMQKWLRRLEATGGRGGEEVVGKALETAVALPWRRGNGERLIFQIGDEPPSRDGAKRMLQASRRAAEENVRVVGLAASGVEDKLEFLLRQAAALTNGRYLFLTDDSGVGLAHAEPKIACYRVTRLKSLLTRVLTSELTGVRVEAPKADVIRTVGAYDRGVCRN